MVSLQGLTVGQVAERSGIAVSAVHFYEEKGSSPPGATTRTTEGTPQPCCARSR